MTWEGKDVKLPGQVVMSWVLCHLTEEYAGFVTNLRYVQLFNVHKDIFAVGNHYLFGNERLDVLILEHVR